MPEKVILSPVSIRLSKDEKYRLDSLQKKSNSKSQRELLVKMMNHYEIINHETSPNNDKDEKKDTFFKFTMPYFNKISEDNSVCYRNGTLIEFSANLIYTPATMQLIKLSDLPIDSLNSLYNNLNIRKDLELDKYLIKNSLSSYYINDTNSVKLNGHITNTKKILILEFLDIYKIISNIRLNYSNSTSTGNYVIKDDQGINPVVITINHYFVDSFDDFMKNYYKPYMNISDCNFIENNISVYF